jgi:MFS transporter, SHS family, sialic acid transporter
MALLAALLGWMFDGAEMGVFSMVGRSAVQDILQIEGTPTPEQEAEIGKYFGIIIAVFLVGAATGGVIFGWLGDRIGRVRAMSLSVLTYALFTGLCGFAATPLQLGIFRFIASLGMGGEWALGVALVMEVWPNRSRALMAGLIGAAANLGYTIVGFLGLLLSAILMELEQSLLWIGLSQETAAMLVAHKGWRLLMMMGTLPALLTFLIRIFVPESERWEEEREKGHTSQWATADLLGVVVGGLGPALIIYLWAMPDMPNGWRFAGSFFGLLVAVAGYSYPVIRYLQRVNQQSTSSGHGLGLTLKRMYMGAALAGVALLGTWASAQWAPTWAAQLTQNQQNSKEWTQIVLSLGALTGSFVIPVLGNWLKRRPSYALMCVLSMVVSYAFYQFHSHYNTSFLVWVYFLGVCTSSFYGWLPLYLPELFTTRVRATGQGFAFNFGRILAAIGTLQVGALLSLFANQETYAGLKGGYPAACSTICVIYLLGLVLIYWAPETKDQPLPD